MKTIALITVTFLSLCNFSFAAATNNISTNGIPSHAVVLLYHHVAADTPASTSVSPIDFQRQMDYLKENNFQVWSLEKITKHLANKNAIPDKVVGISFDDSYVSIYTTAYPILKKNQWPFTIFVSSGAIDDGQALLTSWEHLREMADNGATIANHSFDHAHLLEIKPSESQQQWQQRVRENILAAEQRIEQQTGHNSKLFAYPYGEHNNALMQLVTSMGYIAFGQQSGAIGENANMASLARFPVGGHYTNLDDFILKLHTLPLPTTAIKASPTPLAYQDKRPTLTLQFAPNHGLQSKINCFASNQVKLKLIWDNPQQLSITPQQDVAVGRTRYNCTALLTTTKGNQRYYWFSQPWIRLTKDGALPSD